MVRGLLAKVEMNSQDVIPNAANWPLPNNGNASECLACPNCGVPLGQELDKLSCLSCRQYWSVVDGVPHFVSDFPYWGEIPQEQMQEINRLIQAENWKTVLAESTEPCVQRASTMILNIERANWHYLLDLPSDSRVLDLGAGTGTTSHALATHYREIVALEPVLERVQFMQQRFSQENLSNVRLVRSSLWTLPFAPESFDLVVMNGVLEWVAEGRAGNPKALQESALKNAFRLLRPGGYLYVGIENRFSPGYFVGYNDPHAGIPFVAVLPRFLAHFYARRKGLSGYRNYLYSSAGYHKLLKRAGFTRSEFYLAIPSYNHPRFLIPMAGNSFSYYSRIFNNIHSRGIRTLLHSLLVRFGVMKYFEYSFVIFAGK
jgi:SAM-dependent methyltransferase